MLFLLLLLALTAFRFFSLLFAFFLCRRLRSASLSELLEELESLLDDEEEPLLEDDDPLLPLQHLLGEPAVHAALRVEALHWNVKGLRDEHAPAVAHVLQTNKELQELGFEETFLRLFEFYFHYCEGGFDERHIDVAQLTLAKPGARCAPMLGSLAR